MEVIVVGAGMSGLTAAISLRRAGHKVTIYERSSLANEIGAALNIPPNVSRFLIPWGLDPVRSRFVETPGMWFMSPFVTLELLPGPLARSSDFARNRELYGAPTFLAHRVDLHEGLKRLATGFGGPGRPIGIEVRMEVVGYNTKEPSVTLKDGTTKKADLVIAADGVHSIGIEYVLGRRNPPQAPGSGCNVNVAYRFLIPRADIAGDLETRFFIEGPEALGTRVWPDIVGRRRFICYPCRNHEILNFAGLVYEEGIDVESTQEDWLAPVDKSEVLTKFTGYHPGLLAVINKATEVKRWPLLYRSPIPTWHKDRLVLAGDACHPMLPNHGQGAAQGIEDGLALGLVMAGLDPRTESSSLPEKIEARLQIYESIRRNRASAIQVMSNYGYDQTPPPELEEYLEGVEILVSTPTQQFQLQYGADVVKRTIETMTAFDPAWKVPDDFFTRQE